MTEGSEKKWTVRVRTVDSAGRSTVYVTAAHDEETVGIIMGAVGGKGTYLLLSLEDGRLASVPQSLITEAVAMEVNDG